MIVTISEHQELSKTMAQMIGEGFHFVAFPTGEVSDSSNLSYFKTAWETAEYCFDMSTDVDLYKSLPIRSVLSDLER